jgi:hypothetical protein
LASDPEPEIRRVVAERMTPEDTVSLLQDAEWSVRFVAAMNAPIEAIKKIVDDPDPEVRDIVKQRLARDKK